MQLDDFERFEVRRSLEDWGIFRDAGEWEALEQLFHPDGVIRVAWFDGHFRQFLERSKASAGKGFSKHIVCNSSVSLRESRACAETNVILIGRSEVKGVAYNGETHMRFLDCLQRSEAGRWQIVDRSTVYDHDVMSPGPPDDGWGREKAEIEKWPIEYRYLALRLSARGITVLDRLPTKGSEAEKQIRLRCVEWLLQERLS